MCHFSSQQQAAIMAAASAAGGGAYIGAAPMAIATQIPPSALNGIASPGVVPSAQGIFLTRWSLFPLCPLYPLYL